MQMGPLPAGSSLRDSWQNPRRRETQMNAAQAACAPFDRAKEWDRLQWPHYERRVRRLQARIVKATGEGRWGKVQALQRLLTHSFSGKALAVKRVTDNRGKRTPGVDGAVWR